MLFRAMRASSVLGVVFLAVLLRRSESTPATGGATFLAVGPRDDFNMQSSLEAIFKGTSGTRRLAVIEASMSRTFHALPKNENGRLAPRAVRHFVHSYFAKEHGWVIKGLSQHGRYNITDMLNVSFVEDKAPAIGQLLAKSHQVGGLSFLDAVVLVASMEHIISHESLNLLVVSYRLNGLSTADALSEADLHEVLQSYLLCLFEDLEYLNGIPPMTHMLLKNLSRDQVPILAEFAAFEGSVVNHFGHTHRHGINPFRPVEYSFETVSEILLMVTHDYGKWQDADCQDMHSALVDLDPHMTGRVPLGTFYAQPPGAGWHFVEKREDLRDMGILEESSNGPYVRIANYVLGPSNCNSYSPYYNVCCLSQCEHLINELEGMLQAPVASPERLITLVEGLSSPSIDAPRQLSAEMTARLQAVADHHGGDVPLHGRLFAQWLHYAFPYECPYPHIMLENTAVPDRDWDKLADVSAEQGEMALHINADKANPHVVLNSLLDQWTDDEVLPLIEDETGYSGVAFLRLLMMGALGVAVLRSVLGLWKRSAQRVTGSHEHVSKMHV